MTEDQKQAALADIHRRIEAAESNDMPRTAQSWRDYYVNVERRPAHEIVCGKSFEWF